MARKLDKSKSLVPVSTKRTPPARKSARTAATVEITPTSLLPILGSPQAVAKLPGVGGAAMRDGDTVLVLGRDYAMRDRTLPAAEVYFVDGAKPRGDGPWLGEADKVSWRDEASGFDCIMLRNRERGFLSGYVGIPTGHPLWGWERDAIPTDLGVHVHGGIAYSALCQEGPSPERRIVREAQRICHPNQTNPTYAPLDHATGHRVGDAHAWWFGFDCNQVYDLIPKGDRPPRFLREEVGTTYRDDAYIAREVLALAAQLRAIADGVPVPPRFDAPPPIGLDPHKGGRA